MPAWMTYVLERFVRTDRKNDCHAICHIARSNLRVATACLSAYRAMSFK